MRHFSLDESHQKLPELAKIFTLCRELRVKAEKHVENMKRLERGGPAEQAQAAIERSQVEFIAGCLEHTLRSIEVMGAVLKGLDPALVDFPHRFEDGREVYLCWREGETVITHYHTMTEGFSSRKPLPKKAVQH